jgi:dephospho-CoA kinase
VSSLLSERGAVIVDADQIARDLQAPGAPVLDLMAERFGAHIIRDDGSLDRAAVAALVFGESDAAKQALKDLNGIVHPAMQSEIERQIAAQADTDHIVVLDFPLLGENPREGIAATIVVDVPVDVAVERLVEFRGMDEADARNRVASQISREERLARATHVVDNSRTPEQLRDEVDRLWQQLVELRDR